MTNMILMCDWQKAIDALPCLCWGVIVLIAFNFVLKSLILPYMTNYHERKMKRDTFVMEMLWKNLIEIKASTDEALKDHVEELKASNGKLEKQLKSEKNNYDLLEKQLKLYSDIFEKLKVEIKPKEK